MTGNKTSASAIEPCFLRAPSALGHLVFLSMGSPVDDLAANFLPPISFGQYQLYRVNAQIVGALTWVWLDGETEARLLADGLTPPPEAAIVSGSSTFSPLTAMPVSLPGIS